MKHFATEQWVDLARGVAPADEQAVMTEHLRVCKQCNKTFEWLKALTAVTQRERGSEPLEWAVRAAKAWFTLEHPQRRAVASMIIDSFRQPALAGIRTTSTAPRQFVYQSEDVVVDLKIEPLEGADGCHIDGQVMSKGDRFGLSYVPVALRKGKQQLAKTFTNRFGEFQFEPTTISELNLTIALPESHVIEILLGRIELEGKEP